MGYIRHDAIIVTSWQSESVRLAYEQAGLLGLWPTSISEHGINGYNSFMIPPDGSKEGWSDSNDYDEKRARWKAWVAENFGNSHNRWLDWVHVQFAGDDRDDDRIVDRNPREVEE